VAVSQSYDSFDSEDHIRLYTRFYQSESELIADMKDLKSDLLYHKNAERALGIMGLSKGDIYAIDSTKLNHGILDLIQGYMLLGSGYYVDPDDLETHPNLRTAMLNLANYY
jgi:hypothetical protein